MTVTINRTCSAVDSMIRKKWHDDGNDNVMVYSINLCLEDLER